MPEHLKHQLDLKAECRQLDKVQVSPANYVSNKNIQMQTCLVFLRYWINVIIIMYSLLVAMVTYKPMVLTIYCHTPSNAQTIITSAWAQSQVTPAGQILSVMGPPSNFLTIITSAQSQVSPTGQIWSVTCHLMPKQLLHQLELKANCHPLGKE